MDISQKILSDITVFMKYAKFQPEKNRRETWEELVTRNKEMHQKSTLTLKMK
jgi:ribonucleoside-triphosphate reductase (thioredoxin)